MPRATRFAACAVMMAALTACQGGPAFPLAPSVVAPAGLTQAQSEIAADWGVASSLRPMAASGWSGFPCALGPFGLAERSQFVVSASGTESLVCSGLVSVPPPEGGAVVLADFPCTLPSGTVTVRSRFVVAPSGEATLTCQSK